MSDLWTEVASNQGEGWYRFEWTFDRQDMRTQVYALSLNTAERAAREQFEMSDKPAVFFRELVQ